MYIYTYNCTQIIEINILLTYCTYFSNGWRIDDDITKLNLKELGFLRYYLLNSFM